jgi:hypothetical protein
MIINPQLTEERVIAALERSHGLMQPAARELRTTREIIFDYSCRFPAVRRCISDNRESTLDMAEARLISAVRAGNLKAIIFFLKTRGRERGYGQKFETEVTGEYGGPVVIETVEVRLAGGRDSNKAAQERFAGHETRSPASSCANRSPGK